MVAYKSLVNPTRQLFLTCASHHVGVELLKFERKY